MVRVDGFITRKSAWWLAIVASFFIVILGFFGVLKPVAAQEERRASEQTFTVTSTDNVQLNVHVVGPTNAPAIMFVHGFAQSADSWQKQRVDELAKKYRVITFDLRGHGDSNPKTGVTYTGKSFADDIEAIRKALRINKLSLVGWSFGVTVVGDYLTHYGQSNVSSVVAVNGPAAAGPDTFTPEFMALMPGLTSDDPTLYAKANADFADLLLYRPLSAEEKAKFIAIESKNPAHVRRAILSRTDLNVSEAYKKLSVPVWVVWGRHDEVINEKGGEQVALLVPHAKYTVYGSVGHSPFWEVPSQFNADLKTLLSIRN